MIISGEAGVSYLSHFCLFIISPLKTLVLALPAFGNQRCDWQSQSASDTGGNLASHRQEKGPARTTDPRNHPTLYAGTFTLELDALDLRQSFVRLKVYTGEQWVWMNYPTRYNRYFEKRRQEVGWESESPKLLLKKNQAEIHFLQTKTITAKKIVESKRDPDLVTVAVDLNVKQLAVITVRQHGVIKHTGFVSDAGLDQHRYQHLKKIAKKQWQSGKAVKGERSNQQLWAHIRRQNQDTAHKTARAIVDVCEQYPGCVLLFERLRKIKSSGVASREGSIANKLTNCKAKSINSPKKSLCHWCGERGSQSTWHLTVLFALWLQRREVHVSGRARVIGKGGKLFSCPACHYECHADFNASVNVHHSFFREFHWQPRAPKSG